MGTTVELPLNQFFMQLMQLSAYKVLTLFFGHILRSCGTKIQATTRRKLSQWNYHTKPIVELPLAVEGSAAVLWLFAVFVHLRIMQHSRATFGTKLMNKYFQKSCTGHCPSRITIMELPLAAWRSAAMA